MSARRVRGAAAALPPAGDERGSWLALARRAGAAELPEEGAERAQRLLVIVLDGQRYALPVERVREIVRMRPITPVPRAPGPMRGVIALRGQVLQVLDLRRRLGLPDGEPGRANRIVVAHDGGGQVAGILVDGVAEVAAAPEDAFCEAPGGQQGAVGGLCRVGGAYLPLVDLDRVMSFDAAD